MVEAVVRELTTIRGRTSTKIVELGDPVYTEEELRALHIVIARQTLREEQKKGFDEDPRVIVDRRFDVDERTVKLFGKIEYVSRSNIREVVIDAFEYLNKISPYETGRYIGGHTLLVNGIERDWSIGGIQALELKPTDVIQIVNIMPYARKIEQGSSLQAPRGVYTKTFGYLKRKYGQIVFIKNRWVQLAIPPSADTTRGRKAWDVQRQYRYPAIQIKASRQGARI